MNLAHHFSPMTKQRVEEVLIPRVRKLCYTLITCPFLSISLTP